MRQFKGCSKLNGPKLKQTVTLRIAEAGLSQTVQTDSKGRGEFPFTADLTLWSPEHPKLYRVEITSESDQVIDHIGFRSIEARGTNILLNGKPIFLPGISIHEDAPTRPGRAC